VDGRKIKSSDFSSAKIQDSYQSPAICPEALKSALHVDHFQSLIHETNRGSTLLQFFNEEDFALVNFTGTFSSSLKIKTFRYVKRRYFSGPTC